MFINLSDDEKISLTLKEISILIALAGGPANGYTIAKLCAADAQTATTMSHGSLYPALKRLAVFTLIRQVDRIDLTPNPGQPRIVYVITPIGHLILEQHLASLGRLIALGQDRLKTNDKP